MQTINLTKTPFKYNKETKTFSFSEKNVQFATSYKLKNREEIVFDFSHSTGPEFDPNTKWVYKSKCGFTLEVCNDRVMTAINAKNYLNAKLQK